jgi:hypothetical protein
MSEIHGGIENQPVVFDTVVAEVEPGPLVFRILAASAIIPVGRPYWFKDARFQDEYRNAIPYTVTVTNSAFTLVDGAEFQMESHVGLLPAESAVPGDTATLVFTSANCDKSELLRTVVTLTTGNDGGKWVVRFSNGSP